VRGSEQAEFFVVTDGGGVEACAMPEFTDFHFVAPSSLRLPSGVGEARIG
jgi:hypothetical protein